MSNNRGWLVLARAADLCARLGITVQVDRLMHKLIGEDAGFAGWRFTITTYEDETDLDAPTDCDETTQLCELHANRWFERMNDRSEKNGWAAPDRECSTCGAAAATPCVPVHAGERDSGGWSHPSREEASGELNDWTEAIAWARKIRRGDFGEALPGVPLAGSWMEKSEEAGMHDELRPGVRHLADVIVSMYGETIKAPHERCSIASVDGHRCDQRADHHGSHRWSDGERTVEWFGTPIRTREVRDQPFWGPHHPDPTSIPGGGKPRLG